ncbi:MAG: CheC, phosphatase, inhibitor of methylation / FliN fusion protein [Firmicutes bacterium]|nr:CheC, phosphatase, inhibitor of methylation / FliN fusion protein [Bacillota bacterium]
MSEGFLSQEEIDALLRGDPISSPVVADLSDIEKDALGEIGNISMGSAATTLSVLLGRRVSITTPRVSVASMEKIKNQYPLPYVVIEVGYTHGILGTNVLAIREQDALIISDLMMGGDGTNPPPELNELYLSAVSEAMNQMMGGVATSLSTLFRKKIDISPPSINLMDFAAAVNITTAVASDDHVVSIAFRMEVEDLIDSEIMQIIPISVAKEMVDNLMNSMQSPEEIVAAPVATPSKSAVAPQVQQQVAVTPPKQQQVNVQPVQFAPLVQQTLPVTDTNINLIMDVPLQVTVELGRTRKLIRDILELAPGSVIELDKLAGEPVDILVNSKLIAKGEVVVIDDNFGVRITEIISPLERTYTLQ